MRFRRMTVSAPPTPLRADLGSRCDKIRSQQTVAGPMAYPCAHAAAGGRRKSQAALSDPGNDPDHRSEHLTTQ